MTALAEKIRQATLRSLKARNRYADEVTAALAGSLKAAQDAVHRAIGKYSSLGSLPDNKLAALKGLEKLQAEIDAVTATMRREQTLRFRQGSKGAFRKGIYQGIEEFAAAQLPFYRDLRPEGIEKLGTKVFTLVDTDALDFMVNYNLTLAGDVQRELSDGIKRTILTGIATGKGAGDIVRDLGEVIVDKDSFRQAGTRVFPNPHTVVKMKVRPDSERKLLDAIKKGRMESSAKPKLGEHGYRFAAHTGEAAAFQPF